MKRLREYPRQVAKQPYCVITSSKRIYVFGHFCLFVYFHVHPSLGLVTKKNERVRMKL